MSFLLKIENIAKSSKILISGEPFFSRSKDRSRTHDQKYQSYNYVIVLYSILSKKSEFFIIFQDFVVKFQIIFQIIFNPVIPLDVAINLRK